MSKYSLKCAKPDEGDFEVMHKLLILENLFDNRFWRDNSEDWRDWDDDDEDKQELLDCEKDVRQYEGLDSNDEVDNRLILYEYVKRMFNNSSAFRRVEMAAQMAIDNCFDPDKDYIDWKPEIQNAINYRANHEEEVDKWCKDNILPEEEEDCRIYTINEAYCKNRNYSHIVDDYILETEECKIVFNFIGKPNMVISVEEEGKVQSVRVCKDRLTLFDLRENLRMFKCQKTLDLVGTNL